MCSYQTREADNHALQLAPSPLQCAETSMCSYQTREADNTLGLDIPMEAATNQAEVAEYKVGVMVTWASPQTRLGWRSTRWV